MANKMADQAVDGKRLKRREENAEIGVSSRETTNRLQSPRLVQKTTQDIDKIAMNGVLPAHNHVRARQSK